MHSTVILEGGVSVYKLHLRRVSANSQGQDAVNGSVFISDADS